MKFTLEHNDPKSAARAGTITTDHGKIQTPIFMPVGTAGTVKGVHTKDLREDTQAQIILGNTYHLFLRPGTEILKAAGGLHKFNGWDRPILTDSGGYQVYSLANQRKITEEGATFASHIDGTKHLFTPERVMDIQREIGADIIMAFDECPPYPSTYDYAKQSMHMTHRWLDRCFNRINETDPLYGYEQTLFPIIQGSTYEDLRNESAEYIASKNADGNAIGGLSVGEPAEEMYKHAAGACAILPKDKPRYLMGVGTPANILENISLGIDMFDCVMPTRNGRNGQIFTSEGILNLRNKKWENVHEPLDPNGTSFVDSQYTKAYVRHLIHSKESLGAQIASLHNIRFYLWLVEQAREHIIAGDFASWKNQILPKLEQRL
ncbi:MAG: tRNA guanosine(34) transglycosylase Tgt [Flavobacteriales bacterium]|jgi:queuine tRNA-ribosyltransferase|nr:tRNA guanosine(34) transglycosylase Tgt [Flavobacteriales bacterium]MDA8994593.1 tRNA guanosine(34) transglycosylase Tgt [Schleiferiaceae bacterium]MDP4617180.1 tRNA guanosine(34) transglycosylase Tgt [Schleiferiaceae bacterium]MDP4759834.1 tRNA guanosine(34) transglycosylase Tgt [Schleiferiaceae bacterium]MDP4768353.1 tRNA guanosine(34) transglycosylase Tgt [Schleiferiaceae bacterium]